MMINELGENIRRLRRDKKLTQEQLAETLGISTGAVSKWESGASNPELPMLVCIADFFEVSTDSLIGFKCSSRGLEQCVADIRRYSDEKRTEDALRAAEDALRRYPNSFPVLYHSAKTYDVSGLYCGDTELLRRASELYIRASVLISQNTDPKISYEGLQIHIGLLYSHMGEHDKAIEHLGRYNILGINNADIGYILSKTSRFSDALTPLSENLIQCITHLYVGTIAMINSYEGLGEPKTAIELSEWMITVLEGLHKTSGSYTDKLCVSLYVSCALLGAKDIGKAREYLVKAKATAELFDASPTSDCASIRFYQAENHPFYDDLGESAVESVSRILNSHPDVEVKNSLIKIWEELNK